MHALVRFAQIPPANTFSTAEVYPHVIAALSCTAEQYSLASLRYDLSSGMYGRYALQESVRQMRGSAPAQIPGAKISVCHGVGGMFAASGTIIFSKKAP
jgi:hypothetical protein